MSEDTLTKKLYRWRVRAGLLGLILAFVLSRANWQSILVGFGMTVLGLSLRLWAAGHLRKEKEITVSGPYRHTRNPLYLANLIIGIGVIVCCRSWWMLGVFVVYFSIFYPVIIRHEADKLRKLFPEAYKEFSRNVPLFLPRLRPRIPPADKSFKWDLYRKNHEVRALTGALVFWSLLILRTLLF